MKKLACFVLTLVLCLSFAVAALAYEDTTLSYTRKVHYFEYDPVASTYVSVHYWDAVTASHTFRVYSQSDNSVYTGAQTMRTNVQKTEIAESASIRTMPDFSSNMTNNGRTITCTYSDGSFMVYFYGDFYYTEGGQRVFMHNTLHNAMFVFSASKTLNK